MNNFTPIDDLVQEYKAMKYGTGSSAKEVLLPSSSEIIQSSDMGENEEAQVEKFITPKKDASISLPPDLKKIGIKATGDDNQFQAALYKLKLPISDEKIMDNLKAAPSESKRWYATILFYMLEMAHLTLKKVGTKVVRVFKTS